MKLWFKLDDGQVVLKECRLDRVLGRQAVLKQQAGNKEAKFPAGTRLVIRGVDHSGWSLELPTPCRCCKLTGRICGISWEGILIDGPVPAPPSKAALDAARLVGGDAAVDQLMRAWKRKRYYVGDDDE